MTRVFAASGQGCTASSVAARLSRPIHLMFDGVDHVWLETAARTALFTFLLLSGSRPRLVWFKVPKRQNRTGTEQPTETPADPRKVPPGIRLDCVCTAEMSQRWNTRTARPLLNRPPPAIVSAGGRPDRLASMLCSSGGEYPRHEPQRRLMTQPQRRGWQNTAFPISLISTPPTRMLRITPPS